MAFRLLATRAAPAATAWWCAQRARCSDDAPLGSQRLAGSVALVTGGASGIGKACAVRLAREGASVVVFDTRREPREGGADVLALMAAARAADGVRAPERADALVLGSVADAARVDAAVAHVVAHFGRLDVLVHSAAIVGVGHALTETSEGEWDAIHDANAKGTFLVLRAAVAQFLRQERRGRDGVRGRAVVVASQHGMVHAPNSCAYGASKAVAAYLVRQVGCEYIRHGVVVNAVAPGRILTGRAGSRGRARGAPLDADDEADLAASEARTPHAALRLGTPEDVASSVAFLASEHASFIVGENLMVDGGYTAS